VKVISVPLSTAAMRRLDTDACIEGDLSDLQLDREAFEVLWRTGIFRAANSALGVNIDEYEDQAVVGAARLEVFSSLLERWIAMHPSVDALRELKVQVGRALEHETGVYLYF